MTSWPSVPIKQCARVVGGSTPKSGVLGFWDGDIAWVTPKDLSDLDGKFIHDTPRKISQLGLKSCSAELLPADSVLFSSRAPIGHVAINTRPMATNQGFKSFVPGAKLDPSFLYWWLRANRSQLEHLGNGATFKEVSKAVVERIEIPLPPLDEQKRIAAILDQANELRRKRRLALERLDSLNQASFVDMFGEDSRGGDARLGFHLSFITSGSRGWAAYYAPTGKRFVRSLDVQMNSIGEDDIVFVTPPDNAEARRTEVAAGDVLLTITGSRIGRVAAVPNELAGSYVSQHVAILRPKNSILPRFLAFYMSLEGGGQQQIVKAQYGQTKPGLNFEQIRDFRVPISSMSLQRQFVSLTENTEALATHQRVHLAKLDALFDSLQHRAFSGKLTSKDAERELAMAG